ncbi:MAG: flagellar brake protein [bacterium]|nr:flagellar brake protein [bacterium]
MFEKTITLGDKLTIIQQGNYSKEQEKEYVSKVLDFKGEDELHIGIPLEHLNEVPLTVGDVYKLCIYTKRGLYNCTGQVTESYSEDNVRIGVIKLLEELTKEQRRQYYRLFKRMEVRYRLYSEDEFSFDEEEIKWKKAILTDISGGGAKFHCQEQLEAGDVVELKVRLSTERHTHTEELLSTVISSIPIENRDSLFEVRVKFSKIDIIQREEIIKYVFEEERKQLRREKGLM